MGNPKIWKKVECFGIVWCCSVQEIMKGGFGKLRIKRNKIHLNLMPFAAKERNSIQFNCSK